MRKSIHRQLNWHTLSLQIPIGDSDWTSHKYLFPQAFHSIEFLKEKHGVTKVFLVGHSMRSRTGAAYLAANKNHSIAGFIGIGMWNNGDYPLNEKHSLKEIKTPILDLFGNGGNGKDEKHGKARKPLISKTYQQVMIEDANHKFTEHENEMIDTVTTWLKKRQT